MIKGQSFHKVHNSQPDKPYNTRLVPVHSITSLFSPSAIDTPHFGTVNSSISSRGSSLVLDLASAPYSKVSM